MGRSRDTKLREAVPRVLTLNHAKFVEESREFVRARTSFHGYSACVSAYLTFVEGREGVARILCSILQVTNRWSRRLSQYCIFNVDS